MAQSCALFQKVSYQPRPQALLRFQNGGQSEETLDKALGAQAHNRNPEGQKYGQELALTLGTSKKETIAKSDERKAICTKNNDKKLTIPPDWKL